LLQTFFGLGQTAELEIVLDRPDGKKKLDESSKKDQSLIYYDGETVSGRVIHFYIFLFYSDTFIFLKCWVNNG